MNGLVYIDNTYLLDVQNHSIYIMKITTLHYREDCLSSSSRFYPAPSDSNASFCLHPNSRRLFAPFYRLIQTPLQPLSVETSFTRYPTTPIRNSSSLKLPHRPIRNRRPINLRIRRVLPSLRSRPRALGIRGSIKRQVTAHPPPHILLPNNLSLLPARKVALLAGHDLPRMDNVEEHEGNEHERGVEYVLVCFVDRDAAAVAAGVFD